ncbi:MAG: UDP-N-acetylglucosamine--LPS N-acetylglucosamine transferase [Sphaerochaetaceae bacterium]|nr:UDP-N-acetylglucosamine--LPS N-acetylglucosamine transferase [Sphaerochaetaceae bacterium]
MKGAFIYVDAGKGHYVPAIALRDAFVEMGGEAVVEDLFVVFKSPIVHWCSKNYWRFLLHHPALEKKINKAVDNKTANVLLKNLKIDITAYNHFKRWFFKEKPDFIITTNFMGSALLPSLIKKLGVNCPVFDYEADLFDQVKSGIEATVTKVYVPTSIGVENTIKMGQPENTVTLSPFPLSSKFEKCQKLTKEEARKKLGLKNKFTVLCNLGGEGIGSPDFLYSLVKRALDVQVVVIGGKSKTTEKAFNAFKEKNPDFSLEMRGFVNNPQEYIMACDMQMGKAGANSLMESLFLNRPFLVSEVLYMARHTSKFFQDHYCGWCEDDLEKKVDIIEKCVKDSQEMEKINKAFKDLPVVFSAKKLMEMVLEDTKEFYSKV